MEPPPGAGQDGYTVLGQFYGEIKVFPDNFLRLYRQEYNTLTSIRTIPHDPNTSRDTPSTNYGGKDDTPRLGYGAGYITKIKERNSDQFSGCPRCRREGGPGVASAG